jgi:hypothetical protein
MGRLPGIEIGKGANGHARYLHIDLTIHGNNELLEDFLDSLEIERREDEPRIPLEEFIKEQNNKRGLNI